MKLELVEDSLDALLEATREKLKKIKEENELRSKHREYRLERLRNVRDKKVQELARAISKTKKPTPKCIGIVTDVMSSDARMGTCRNSYCLNLEVQQVANLQRMWMLQRQQQMLANHLEEDTKALHKEMRNLEEDFFIMDSEYLTKLCRSDDDKREMQRKHQQTLREMQLQKRQLVESLAAKPKPTLKISVPPPPPKSPMPYMRRLASTSKLMSSPVYSPRCTSMTPLRRRKMIPRSDALNYPLLTAL